MWEAFCPFHGSAPLLLSHSLFLTLSSSRVLSSRLQPQQCHGTLVRVTGRRRHVLPSSPSNRRATATDDQTVAFSPATNYRCFHTGPLRPYFFSAFCLYPPFHFFFLYTRTHTLNLSHHLNNMAVIVFVVAQGRRPSHARHTL